MKQNERRSAFILAAGLGTRLGDLTKNKPKALVEINKKTLLEVVIENLISQKFNHIVINIHHFGDDVVNYISSKNYENVEIEISDEREQLMDTGGAILKALPCFRYSKAVLIHNVDVISDVDFKSFYDEFVASDDAAWLLTQNRDNKRKLVFDRNANYVGRYNIETKEFYGETEMNDDFSLLSFSGLHFIKPEYFYQFELKACYVFELYEKIAKRNNVKSRLVKPAYWFDLGTQKQLEEASLWLLSQK